MQCLSTFIIISRSILKVRESVLINNWENIISYWEKFQQSKTLANNFGLFQIQLGGLREAQLQENFAIFTFIYVLNSLNWHKVLIWTYFFFLKTCNLIINRLPLLPINIVCLKELSSRSKKIYEIKGTSKFLISQLCSELGKIESTT